MLNLVNECACVCFYPQSKDALQRGDIDSAQRDSVQARKLAIAAIITGAVIIFIVILITVILPIIGVGIAMGTTNIN